ncbi:DUF7858 family protein [Halorientalis salina]|uniref:DUF7858 family protein n=1 Tax=Halorientalis salina TaxID=2932266 RepID=UPI0010AB61DE|nr:hypothetical protein [Halorientalis salina]
MGLSDIAAGVEVTAEQRDCGVATVDETDAPLSERLAEYESVLPCDAEAAATVVDVYAEGRAIGAAARVAGIAPTTAAKTLHLLGEQVTPLGPTARDVIRDWLHGDLARTEALELTGATEREFALAAYVETHDPIPDAREAVAAELSSGLGEGDDPLAETMSGVSDLRES